MLDELVTWAERPVDLQVGAQLILGPGGSGKTRLALELCRVLTSRNWAAGFLRANYDLEQIETLLAVELPRLVVLDYAETRAAQLEELVSQCLESANPQPLRLLLLARRVSGELTSVQALGPGTGRTTRSLLSRCDAPIDLRAHHLPSDARRRLFSNALTEFGSVEQAEEPDLTTETFSLPLLVVVAGWLTANKRRSDDDVPSTQHELLSELLEHERRHWRARPTATDDVVLDRVLAVTTLCPSHDEASTSHLLCDLLDEVREHHNEQALARWAHDNYPGRTDHMWVAPVEPDLIGEHLILSALTADHWRAALGRSPRSVAQSLRVLLRLAANRPDEAQLLSEIITSLAADLCEKAIAQAEQSAATEMLSSGQLAPVLADAVNNCHFDPDQLGAILSSFPVRPNLALSGLALTLQINWTDRHRRLAEADPATYHPKLASSLNNLSNRLDELGRREEGLAASTEAVEAYRRLAEANPATYHPKLALTLNNLAIRLGELGRREEGLDAITEAVEAYRRLAEANPATYLRKLAMSLSNLSVSLGELGRREEGLDAITEAVDIQRRLAEAKPATYLFNLALTLENLSLRLGELGRREEGLDAITEAVDIQRRLAEAKPAAYLRDFALSLNNLANTLDDLGRTNDAAAARTELTNIQQQLVER